MRTRLDDEITEAYMGLLNMPDPESDISRHHKLTIWLSGDTMAWLKERSHKEDIAMIDLVYKLLKAEQKRDADAIKINNPEKMK